MALVDEPGQPRQDQQAHEPDSQPPPAAGRAGGRHGSRNRDRDRGPLHEACPRAPAEQGHDHTEAGKRGDERRDEDATQGGDHGVTVPPHRASCRLMPALVGCPAAPWDDRDVRVPLSGEAAAVRRVAVDGRTAVRATGAKGSPSGSGRSAG